MVVNEEKGEIFRRHLPFELLTAYHSIAVFAIDLLAKHFDYLTLLFSTGTCVLSHGSQVLDSLIVRGQSLLSANLLELGLVPREHLLEDS